MGTEINKIFKKSKEVSGLILEKEKKQIILTTRARLARNLSNFKFSVLNNSSEKKDIADVVKDTFYSDKGKEKYRFLNISRLNKIQRAFLVEKHILSPEMLEKLTGRSLIIKIRKNSFDKSLSILINEEDHLRIQSVYSGLNIKKAYREVSVIEKQLENKLRFAYDRDFGYLTSCPTNIGTSLRISVIAHLPAIVVTDRIEDFIKNIVKVGCSIRGFYGENSDVAGNLFQISNQASLGKYEHKIIDEMKAISLNIIDAEQEALKSLKASMDPGIEDSVYRSYGMLKFARMLSFGEALELLSIIKLGQDLNIIDSIKPFDFYQLISLLGESNIILENDVKLEAGSDDIDRMRAETIRNKILKGIDINV